MITENKTSKEVLKLAKEFKKENDLDLQSLRALQWYN